MEGVVFLLAATINARWASVAPLLTDNDPIEYWEVARNLAAGRGLVSGITWQYLTPQASAVHPSNDYWMPLTSFVLAPFVGLSPIDGALAATPFILIGALAAVVVLRLARRLLGDDWLAVACTLTFVCGFWRSASTFESTVLYVPLLLGVALVWARASEPTSERSLEHPGSAIRDGLALGTLAALCILTRSDSLAVLALVVVSAFAMRALGVASTPGVSTLSWAIVPLGFVVAAWAVRSHLVFGTWWNPASGKTAFLTSYREIFQVDGAAGFSAYLDAVVARGLYVFVLEKLWAIGLELLRFTATAGPSGAVPILVGVALMLRSGGALGVVSVSIVASLALVYGGITTAFAQIGGGFRSAAVTTPIAWVAFLIGVRAIAVDLLTSTPSGRWRSSWLVRLAACAIAAASLPTAWRTTPILATQAARMTLLKPAAEALGRIGIGPDEPLMTTQPFLTRAATGRPALILPIDGIAALCRTASRVGSRYLLLVDDPVYFGLAARLPLRGWMTGAVALPPELGSVSDGPGWRLLALRCSGGDQPVALAPGL